MSTPVQLISSFSFLLGLACLAFATVLASWHFGTLSWFYASSFFQPGFFGLGGISYALDFYAVPDPDADGSVVVGTCDDYSPVQSSRRLRPLECSPADFELDGETFVPADGVEEVILNTNMLRGDAGLPIQNPPFGRMRFSATTCDDPPAPVEGWDNVLCGTCLPVPTAGFSFLGFRVRCGGIHSNLYRMLLSGGIGFVLVALALLCCCCPWCRLRDARREKEPLLKQRRASVNAVSDDQPNVPHSSDSSAELDVAPAPSSWQAQVEIERARERTAALEQRLKDAEARALAITAAAEEQKSQVLFAHEAQLRMTNEKLRVSEADAHARGEAGQEVSTLWRVCRLLPVLR